MSSEYIHYQTKYITIKYLSKYNNVYIITNKNIPKHFCFDDTKIIYHNLIGKVLYNPSLSISYFLRKLRKSNCNRSKEICVSKNIIKKKYHPVNWRK